ncbi:hypothetical protein Pmani_035737 [Petrolisthes manimaculis]|uniref:Uncharacterized protein n=1 Tax=Petrolisthes manimaculis TaxID=1843537 RepID=A0AAE1NK65_9EUCA|nr:hypothetical protein Pmani_035737 [Petrolisthes manimaculis]
MATNALCQKDQVVTVIADELIGSVLYVPTERIRLLSLLSVKNFCLSPGSPTVLLDCMTLELTLLTFLAHQPYTRDTK